MQDQESARERAISPVVALAGLAAVVAAVLICLSAFGLSLVRLATGSMTPAYPAESILLVQDVPAADVLVGDVVTVSRDGTVPITHRVVSVDPRGSGAELVMRGDANAVDDPEPYQVSRVGRVVGGIPFGGGILAAVQSPIGLGVASSAVAGLILWAWWPRREPGAHVAEPVARGAGVRLLRRLLLAPAVLVAAAGASLVAVAAAASPVPETGTSGLLTLDADPYPAQNISIRRGERVLWPVTADLDAPSAGDLSVRIVSAQPLAENPDALRFELASCDVPWDLPTVPGGPATCPGGTGVVEIADAAFATTDAGEVFPLGDIVPGEPRYLLVTLALPLSTPGAVAAQPAELSFGFVAQARALPQPRTSGVTGLAATGGVPPLFLGPALLGAGVLLGGATIARLRSSREEA